MQLSKEAQNWLFGQAYSGNEYAAEIQAFVNPHVETAEFNALIHRNLQAQLDKKHEKD